MPTSGTKRNTNTKKGRVTLPEQRRRTPKCQNKLKWHKRKCRPAPAISLEPLLKAV